MDSAVKGLGRSTFWGKWCIMEVLRRVREVGMVGSLKEACVCMKGSFEMDCGMGREDCLKRMGSWSSLDCGLMERKCRNRFQHLGRSYRFHHIPNRFLLIRSWMKRSLVLLL